MFFTEYNYPQVDLTGKVAVVTGANIGIGLETARQLVNLNARVYLACRNQEKAEVAIQDIKNTTGKSNVFFLSLDLAKLSSVKAFSSEFLEREVCLDILINNAGCGNAVYTLTEDKYENTFQCNYLSHLLLTVLLLPAIKKSKNGRILNVSSSLHSVGKVDLKNIYCVEPASFALTEAYATSKLYQVLSTRALASKLPSSIKIVSSHPGLVSSDIWSKDHLKKSWYYYMLSSMMLGASMLFGNKPQDAAKSSLYAALKHDVESGGYYAKCQKTAPSVPEDDSVQETLLQKSLALLNIDLSVLTL